MFVCEQTRMYLQKSPLRRCVGCEKSMIFLFKVEEEEAKNCSRLLLPWAPDV